MTNLREKILNEYCGISPLLEKIEAKLKNGRVILAIDGGSASGKTTLSKSLEKI